MTTCPICGSELGPNDHITLEFVPKHNWWVLKHYTEYEVHYSSQRDQPDIVRRHSYCGHALTHLTGNPYRFSKGAAA